MEIEIKKKLVIDILQDAECKSMAINMLYKDIKKMEVFDRDSEIRKKYKKLKDELNSAKKAKIQLAEEYCTGLDNIDRILYPPKKINYFFKKQN